MVMNFDPGVGLSAGQGRVILNKLWKLSMLQFPHLQNEDNDIPLQLIVVNFIGWFSA